MTADNVTLSITKEQLSQLPLVEFQGQIHIIDSVADAQEAINLLSEAGVVGFDTETKPSFKKGRTNTVSLIQISTDNDCYLFRINKFGFAQCLIGFMQNPSIIKVGLSLRDDFHVLHRLSPFEPQSFIDLQPFVADYCISDASLQKIYAIIFGARISKSQRLSNWEAESLTEQQQSYASIDAWACLRIYRHLKSGKFNPRLSPYHPDSNENDDKIIISTQN